MVKKPVRSKAGVTVLTVVLPPKKCEHGTCIYCPGGDDVPQSYTDKSPAIMRALALNYDIKQQVTSRLDNLIKMGHPTEKLEVIIIGGTFLQYPKKIQRRLHKRNIRYTERNSIKDNKQSKKDKRNRKT